MPRAHELGAPLDDVTLEGRIHFADELVAHRDAAKVERVRADAWAVSRIDRGRDGNREKKPAEGGLQEKSLQTDATRGCGERSRESKNPRRESNVSPRIAHGGRGGGLPHRRTG